MQVYKIDDKEVIAWYDVQLKRIYYNEACESAHPIIVLVFQN